MVVHLKSNSVYMSERESDRRYLNDGEHEKGEFLVYKNNKNSLFHCNDHFLSISTHCATSTASNCFV